MSLRPPSQYRNRPDPRETWSFYVDGSPVQLKGPVATVQQILESAGISPKAVVVRRIWSPEDASGKPVGVLDSVSAFPEGQVFLRTFPISSDPTVVAEAATPAMEPASVVEETLTAVPAENALPVEVAVEDENATPVETAVMAETAEPMTPSEDTVTAEPAENATPVAGTVTAEPA